MKTYRNAVAALVLTFVLSTTAFAGVIHTDVIAPPPTANGVIHTGEAVSTPEAADTVTRIALNLLQSMLSMF